MTFAFPIFINSVRLAKIALDLFTSVNINLELSSLSEWKRHYMNVFRDIAFQNITMLIRHIVRSSQITPYNIS